MINKICPLMTEGEYIVNCQKDCAWYDGDCSIAAIGSITYELIMLRKTIEESNIEILKNKK